MRLVLVSDRSESFGGSYESQKRSSWFFYPKNVESCEVQDMKAVFQHFLDVLSRSEIDSGRFG